MIFATSGFGTTIISELESALRVSIAVAYFNPDDSLIEPLSNLRNLNLVVSDDFNFNNPFKLERLLPCGTIKMIPADSDVGKLHSKVFLIERQNGSKWAMVGSANLTWQGLFSNLEACVFFDSSKENDAREIIKIEAWLNQIIEGASPIDFEIAKKIYLSSKHQYKESASSHTPTTKSSANNFWALKTTAGSYGEQYWPMFIAENVIAIGWEDIGVDPSKVDDDELREEIKNTYPERDPSRAVNKIRKFVNLNVGDLVLICRGYPPNSSADVHIYGIARVTGPFYDDKLSSWWGFKHSAAIQVIDQKIPRRIIAEALQKQSLRETIHELNAESFDDFVKVLRDTIGVVVNL